MGVNDAQQSAKGDKWKKSQDAKASRRSKKTSAQVADWSNANGDLLVNAVAAVSRDGGALRLGYTRDGGAYAIGVYENGQMETEYVSPSEDINDYLRGVISDFTD